MALIAMAIHDTPENGRDKLTERTLESLMQTVDWSRHRFFAVVNSATDRTADALFHFKSILVQQTVRLGFDHNPGGGGGGGAQPLPLI